MQERPTGIMVIYYADFSNTAIATVISSVYTVYSKNPINVQEPLSGITANSGPADQIITKGLAQVFNRINCAGSGCCY